MSTDTLGRLSTLTVALHWIAAAGILVMLGLGLYISGMARGPDKVAMIQLHKSIGVVLLPLLAVRIGWRIHEGWPPPAAPTPERETWLARGVHWFLLGAPLVLIASGIVRSIAYARPVEVFGLPFIPKLVEQRNTSLNEAVGAIHDVLAWLLLLVISLHIAAALRHHLVRRNPTLRRMLGFSRRRSELPTP